MITNVRFIVFTLHTFDLNQVVRQTSAFRVSSELKAGRRRTIRFFQIQVLTSWKLIEKVSPRGSFFFQTRVVKDFL